MDTKIETKFCKRCRKVKPLDNFNRIIKRKSYAPDAEDDGYKYFLKETINCLSCRNELNEREIQNRKKRNANKD